MVSESYHWLLSGPVSAGRPLAGLHPSGYRVSLNGFRCQPTGLLSTGIAPHAIGQNEETASPVRCSNDPGCYPVVTPDPILLRSGCP
jgi:hypothetical protein